MAGALAGALCLGLSASASTTDMTQGITIGVAVYNPDDAETMAFRDYFENYLGEAFNAKFIYSEAITTWEQEEAFVEGLHELGVQGIISSQSIDREAVMELCEEYGIYYIFGSSTLSDEAFDALKDNPYFLGTIGASDESEEKAGSQMADFFAAEDEDKVHSYLICTGGASLGNEMHRIRALAMLTELEELYDISYTVPAEELVLAGEVTEAENEKVKITILPGYPYESSLEEQTASLLADGSYDTLMSVTTVNSQMEAVREAEDGNQIDIRVGAIDCFTEQNYRLFNGLDNDGEQELNYLVGKYGAIVAPAFAAICNAYAGYAEDFREDGHAFRLNQSYWIASDKEEFNTQYALSIGIYENTYSAADIMSVLKEFNADADFEAFAAFTQR